MEKKFTYFLSYARSDAAFALKLAKDLRAAGVQLWLDQLDIVGGQRWDRAVEEALQACGGVIVVLTPASVQSHNVMDEVHYALEEGKRMLPVMLTQCQIPFRLRRFQRMNFTSDYDQGFSDLRRALHDTRQVTTGDLLDELTETGKAKRRTKEQARGAAEAPQAKRREETKAAPKAARQARPARLPFADEELRRQCYQTIYEQVLRIKASRGSR